MKDQNFKNIQNAQDQHQVWKGLDFEARQLYFSRLATLLLDKKEDLGLIITEEMNKPISQSVSEIEKCAGLCLYYAKAENVLAVETVETQFEISEVHHEALGVILGVMPWNYPFWQVLRFAVPTLLAGNAVVMKHASNCLRSGDAIQNLFEEAGFPIGLFQHLRLGHEEVEELIAHPIIKAVSLTGSEAAGRKIAEIAGRNLKKCVLELGGNDAFIILADADLQLAAKNAATARLQNCGQTCVSGKRFIIHQEVYEAFLHLFVDEYKKFVPTNAFDRETKLSKMSRADLAVELNNQYQTALDHGAEIILPLEQKDDLTFIPGLLKMNVHNPISDQELFGPLGMVFCVKSDEEALEVANNTSFGLANAVFTQDRKKAFYFANNLESGSVAINQLFKSDVRLPFNGRKNSGYGIELSTKALFEFTAIKTIIGKV
ncbi:MULTISPECIES: aldehyde dehydrogenase family protein [Amniculibacterium]|uniref:aldehyde dehydrogenase family protein n=1 Tax=Amniculibacterium TaxID=2715289 RepID=UPI000F59CFA7|nr:MULTISPECIES: aldehyde dehydrogenase family protein [Amniculibacterium]